MPRRDSIENLSFWTSSTKRKFFQQQVVKETGFLPDHDTAEDMRILISRNSQLAQMESEQRE